MGGGRQLSGAAETGEEQECERVSRVHEKGAPPPDFLKQDSSRGAVPACPQRGLEPRDFSWDSFCL